MAAAFFSGPPPVRRDTPVADESEDFHAHLKRCRQCADHPFGLCVTGERLLKRDAAKINGSTVGHSGGKDSRNDAGAVATIKDGLIPCPKCGQKNEGEDIQTPVAENADVIRCWNCGAETEGHEPGTGQHREAWNRGEVFLHNADGDASARKPPL